MNQTPTKDTEPKQKKRWPRWVRWPLEIGVFVVAFLFIASLFGPDLPEGSAPELNTTTLDGIPVALGQPDERPLALVFWATWCGICKAELPWLTNMAESHRLVTVAMQSGDDATVADFMQENDLTELPVINDPDGQIAATYGVNVTPTFVFFSPEGQITGSTTGLTSPWGVRARLWWAGR